MDNLNSPDKLARRIRKSLKRATAARLSATTERAQKRHERRAAEARKALSRLDKDGFAWGAAFSQD